MRRMLLLPRLAGGGMQEAQQAMAALLDGVLRTNLRMARDIARMADPTSVLDMQRRFMREHLEAMMEGSARILRAARHAADDTLRPLEQHLHEMRGRRPTRDEDDTAGWWPQRGSSHHRVAEVMRTGVRMVAPDDTVQQAARVMAEEGTATLPVGEDGRLVGVVTDATSRCGCSPRAATRRAPACAR
jgi:CBS domain